MCITPRVMTNKNGLRVTAECQTCWQCKANKVNDWVGRGIAEEQYCAGSSFVTLTYGGDDKINKVKTELGASILIYSDVQRYIRKYRDAGYPCRYMLSGEYGSLKGRSHWHLILFWEIEVPPNPKEVMFTDSFWCSTDDEGLKPFGHSLWRDVNPERIAYVCKYLVADEADTEQETIFKTSKYPPLGAEYFRRRANTFVQQGILPKDGFYSFPDVRDKKTGLPRKFFMRGVTLDNFCEEFIRLWTDRYGEHPLDTQHSDWLLRWCDTKAKRSSSEVPVEPRKFVSRPLQPPHFAYAVTYDDRLNTYVAQGNGERLLWRPINGEWGWQKSLV